MLGAMSTRSPEAPETSDQPALSKLPAITLSFWVMKIAATTRQAPGAAGA